MKDLVQTFLSPTPRLIPRLNRLSLAMAAASMFSVGSNTLAAHKTAAGGPTISCGSTVVNQPSLDAAPTLNACFASGAAVVELAPGRYNINSQVVLTDLSDLVIKTQGVSGGAACLSPGASACAIITAADARPGGHLVVGTRLARVTFDHIAIDGSIAQRRGNNVNLDANGFNADFESCESCTFRGFASVRAPAGTGMAFRGTNGVFDTVLFRDNGWGRINTDTSVAGKWADGLTVLDGPGIHIFNSTFQDNSDIDLILGGARGGIIENNHIGNTYNYAFAALMLDNFTLPDADGVWRKHGSGDYTNAVIQNNQIDCGKSMCGIGINLGGRLWYAPGEAIFGGQIINNSILAARQGILGYGANSMDVSGNGAAVYGIFVTPGTSLSTFFLSSTSGDTANFHDNSQTPSANALIGSSPQLVSEMVSNFANTDLTVSQIFRDALGRDPDSSGGPAYTSAYQNGMTASAIRSSLANSQEAANFIDALYQKTLGRAADPGGLANWQGYLAGSGSVARIYVLLQQSPEGLAHRSLLE